MRFMDRVDVAHLVRRLGTRDALAAAEIAAVALLALLVARLVWAIAAPLGPIGAASPQPAARQGVDHSVFARFDPFFAMPGSADPLVVSDLNLDLFGTRVDNVSGRGSAIMAADGGPQRSYVVGEELLPGVTLHSVAFDSVTISRGGSLEQLFLDQSVPAQPVSPSPSPSLSPAQMAAAQPAKPRLDVTRLLAEVEAVPVLAGGRVDGVRLQPEAGGQLLNELGLQAGDVILAVNRQRIDTQARAEGMAGLLGNASVAELEIRRGAEVVNVSFEVAR